MLSLYDTAPGVESHRLFNPGPPEAQLNSDFRILNSCSPAILVLQPMPFSSIPEAIEDFRAGRMLVIVDDEDRENEGDLTVAAEKVTPEIINFMAKHARGLICLSLSAEICDALHLPPMSSRNTSRFGTAFCESIEAAEGVTTGISAADRARTIRVAIDPAASLGTWRVPAMSFPLRAREGGVLVRAGQTEAAVDLARLAGLRPGGVICEIMNDDGSMARVPQLEEFCARHDLRMISVADLIRYRLQTERFVQRQSECCLRTEFGDFKTVVYASTIVPEQHLALVHGEIAGRKTYWFACIHIASTATCSVRRIASATTWSAGRWSESPRKARACWFTSTRPARAFAITPLTALPTASGARSMKAASARRFFPISACIRFGC